MLINIGHAKPQSFIKSSNPSWTHSLAMPCHQIQNRFEHIRIHAGRVSQLVGSCVVFLTMGLGEYRTSWISLRNAFSLVAWLGLLWAFRNQKYMGSQSAMVSMCKLKLPNLQQHATKMELLLSISLPFRTYSVCGVERWRTWAKVPWPPVLTCDRKMVPIIENECKTQ
jgi:hypothetical protein